MREAGARLVGPPAAFSPGCPVGPRYNPAMTNMGRLLLRSAAALLIFTAAGCSSSASRASHVAVIAPARLDNARLPALPDPFAGSAHRATGTCTVQVTLKSSGKVRASSLARSSGFQGIDDICVKGALKVLFFPATKDGRPVDFAAQLSMMWRLDHWEFQIMQP